jgi:ATP/ADP translocase
LSSKTIINKRIEKDEWPTLIVSSFFAFGSVALAIFIRTWSDTLFLTHFRPEKIPIFYIWSAVIFAPTTMGYTWLSQRFNLVRLNTATLITFASACLFCIHPTTDKTTLFILLLMMSLVSPLVNAICWGLILERINSRQSKRLLPLISSSATIGATISGTLGAEIIEWGGNPALMSLICLTLLVLTPFPRLLIKKLETSTPIPIPEESQTQKLFDGLHALSRNRLLRVSAVATFLMAIATNLVDYLFKVKLQAELTPAELGPFFARFHAISNLAILLIQLTILSPILQRFGVKNSFRLYPGFLVTVGSLCLFYSHLWFFTLLRGVDTIMKFTFHQNTENLLMTPVPFLERTQSKVFLKGVIYPLGGLIAGILIYLIDFSGYVLLGSLVAMLCICICWLWSVYQTHHHYIRQLAMNVGIESIIIHKKQIIRKKEQKVQIKYIQNYYNHYNQKEHFPMLTQSESSELLNRILIILGYQQHQQALWNVFYQLNLRQSADLVELLDQLLRVQGLNEMETLLDHIFRQHQLAKMI